MFYCLAGSKQYLENRQEKALFSRVIYVFLLLPQGKAEGLYPNMINGFRFYKQCLQCRFQWSRIVRIYRMNAIRQFINLKRQCSQNNIVYVNIHQWRNVHQLAGYLISGDLKKCNWNPQEINLSRNDKLRMHLLLFKQCCKQQNHQYDSQQACKKAFLFLIFITSYTPALDRPVWSCVKERN